MKKRMLWADSIRIVAIYLVVQIHTAMSFFSYAPWSILIKITVICIPLLVMLSGALLLNKQESYQVFFKKRSLKVLVPWIFWTIIYMFYFLFLVDPKGVSAQFFNDNHSIVIQWLHFFVRMFFSTLWFFPLIFGLYLITPIIRIFIKNGNKKDIYYFLLLWFFSFSLMPYLLKSSLFPYWEPNVSFTIMQYCGYFILGSVLISSKFKKLTIKRLLLLVMFSVLIVFFNTNLLSSFLSLGTVIISTITFYCLFVFSNSIDKKISISQRSIIATISGAALGIYVVHQIVFDYFKGVVAPGLTNYHIDFLLTPLVFVVSLVVVLFLQRIPIVKKIVP